MGGCGYLKAVENKKHDQNQKKKYQWLRKEVVSDQKDFLEL